MKRTAAEGLEHFLAILNSTTSPGPREHYQVMVDKYRVFAALEAEATS